ncbi:fungal peroxidase [Mycena pura]|uniref:Fungal peroxidase n=1 Tax=Mycena pura TaxID=153505 RepID=A0AAD6Y3P8_9AGAR|nr:fungal peroxidase [Mycena pura]
MKLFNRRVVCAAALFVDLASALNPHPNHAFSQKHRHPDAQPDLPTAEEATAAARAAGLNLSDIQGDVLIGMKKNTELFYFFSIANAMDFKPKLASEIFPLITTTTQLLDVNTQPTTTLNIAFSQTGLTALGVTDTLGDSAFAGGQFVDLENLGDPGSANWVPHFAGTGIHGVFLFASDTEDNIDAAAASLEAALGDCVTKVYTLLGAARPGMEAGHEHFGFLDGISNPAVDGFTASPMPGQSVVAAGTVLLGESGDKVARPAWAKDGSFLVFRQLAQLVPEFAKFLIDNPVVEPGVLTAQQGSDLLGARMVGRWKSGAPVDLAPLFDDPELGADPARNNDFTFSHPDETLATNQTRCPFSAHIRKTRPRADLPPIVGGEVHRIMRAGIPYGPEVSDDEAAANTTSTERGLAFVSYQSNIGNGFRFLQQTWAGDADFVHAGTGVDPIIGELACAQRVISGLDPTDSTKTLTLPNFVISRGGEYFFTPSLSAISGTLAVQQENRGSIIEIDRQSPLLHQ